jgi:CRISP-associated protein Cas1
MTWRIVHVGSKSFLNIEKESLYVSGIQTVHIPTEDISCLILESAQITLSASVLTTAADKGWAIFSCDERHLPNGVFHGFHTHSRQTEVCRRQLRWTRSFRQRLWGQIIQRKIQSQADCLALHGAKREAIRLSAIAKRIKPGDPEFGEARAARLFFTGLFGQEFTRRPEISDRVNSALNYGYAILRGCVARTLCGYGFLPSVGIHHDNVQNAFNLADDFVEPLRPLCDHWVKLKFSSAHSDNSLSPIDKRILLELLECDVIVGGMRYGILAAIDSMIASLARASKSGKPLLLSLPAFTDWAQGNGRGNETLDETSSFFRSADNLTGQKEGISGVSGISPS